ncbi:MAG: FliI/YscN family ATPase [Phycisphaerales bacterium]
MDSALRTVRDAQPMEVCGRVAVVRGMTILLNRLPIPIGSLVRLAPTSLSGTRDAESSGGVQLAEVIGFTDQHTVVMMLGSAAGISPGDRAVALHAAPSAPVGDSLLGRCVNALGHPVDARGVLHALQPRRLDPDPIGPLDRRRISAALATGVRAIDLFTTLGQGQRMGVFAGPGVGKSTLLGCIARNTSADVNVIALVGERGREVRDFIEHNLGADGLARSVIVVSTGDESPLMRVRAAKYATTIAEFFRDQGRAVMLMMDSVTRFAHAQRQIGLSVGEPPATRGYTPSVFAAMARLMERAGAIEGASHTGGSITGIYTVLVEGDDMTEPVADAARGILDGHLILSRGLAQRNHYPAIDVLDSVSRVADDVVDAAHAAARRQLVRLIAAYKKVEDLVQIGAYAKGSSIEADTAIHFLPRITELLQQGTHEREDFAAGKAKLLKIALEAGAALAPPGRR